jgi:hypothetical protein
MGVYRRVRSRIRDGDLEAFERLRNISLLANRLGMTIFQILLFPVEQIPALRAYPEFEDVPEAVVSGIRLKRCPAMMRYSIQCDASFA